MRAFQQKCVQNETAEIEICEDSTIPLLLQQTFAKNRMMKFHEELSSIDFHICSVCLENFPSTQMASKSRSYSKGVAERRRIPNFILPITTWIQDKYLLNYIHVIHVWIRFFEDPVYVHSVTIDLNIV